jgi:hypothetical protein
MSASVSIGQVIARCYTVLEVKKVSVPATMSEYASESVIIELDSRYENQSRLSIYTLEGGIPPAGQWPLLVPEGFSDVRVKRSWTPSRINPPCGAIAYKARAAQGHQAAIMQMMAANETYFILAVTSWSGFPGVNSFFVGFKPGMEERTEDLLEAALKLYQ